MTGDAVLDLPRYYLTRDTPAGTVLLYPVEAIEGARKGDRAPFRSGAEAADEAHVRNGWVFSLDEPAGAAWTFAGPWLVASEPISRIRRERPGERYRAGWVRREEPRPLGDEPVSPDLRRAFEEQPERPAEADVEHYAEHEAEHVCWQCRVFAASYGPRWQVGEPVVEVQRLDGWTVLPGGEDPNPDREWRVTEPGYLTLYGAHTRHLWPGVLSGLRRAVVEALEAHPLVGSVTHYEHTDRGKVSVAVRVPFDPPQTIDKRVKATPRARKRTTIVTEDVFGINTSVRDVHVPDEVSGPDKATALDRWQAAVDEQVRRFVPVLSTARVCGHCDGLGITDAGS